MGTSGKVQGEPHSPPVFCSLCFVVSYCSPTLNLKLRKVLQAKLSLSSIGFCFNVEINIRNNYFASSFRSPWTAS